MTWPERPADWDKPGYKMQSLDNELILDRVEDVHNLSVIGGSLTKARTADSATITADIVFNDDTVLTFSSVPAGTYLAEAHLRWTASGNTPDIKVAFSMPSGGEIRGSTFWAQSTTATTAIGSVDTGSNDVAIASGSQIGARGATTVGLAGIISGVMVFASAGTVAVQWAQSTSDAATLKVNAGSWFRLTRLV